MKATVVFRAAAYAELSDAAGWYESRRSGLGRRFIESVDEALNAAASAPLRPTLLLANIRRIRVRGFPFFVYYTVDGENLVVLAIFHFRRDPVIWRLRT